MASDLKDLAPLFQNLSIQLRTCLSSLHLAAAHLIPAQEREADPALDAKAAILDQSYYRLLRLVNNLSAVSALCSGEPLPLQDRDLPELVEAVCLEAEEPARLLGLDLQFRCQETFHPCAVHRESLRQLLFHLLSNAFKFTPRGGSITVELRFSQQQVLLSVSDTGCGISEELLPVLFDRCLHAGDLSLQTSGGAGIGLALCRSIAEAHGGRILAESKPGAGARFTVSLPDRQLGTSPVSDVPRTYASGFNETLMALADALPARAFLLRNQD